MHINIRKCIHACMHTYLYVWNTCFGVQQRRSKQKKEVCGPAFIRADAFRTAITDITVAPFTVDAKWIAWDGRKRRIDRCADCLRKSFVCTCHCASPLCSWSDEVPVTSTTMLKIAEPCMSPQLNDNCVMLMKQGLTARVPIVQETVSISDQLKKHQMSSGKGMARPPPLNSETYSDNFHEVESGIWGTWSIMVETGSLSQL